MRTSTANDVLDRAAAGVASRRKRPTRRSRTAIAHRHHQLGVGRAVVGDAQRVLHVLRHRAGDQQHVGMARAGDELDAAPFEVVVGIVEGVDFQLAAVARTGIDLADGQRAAEDAQDLVVQTRRSRAAGRRPASGARLGEDAGAEDASEQRNHRSAPL